MKPEHKIGLCLMAIEALAKKMGVSPRDMAMEKSRKEYEQARREIENTLNENCGIPAYAFGADQNITATASRRSLP